MRHRSPFGSESSALRLVPAETALAARLGFGAIFAAASKKY